LGEERAILVPQSYVQRVFDFVGVRGAERWISARGEGNVFVTRTVLPRRRELPLQVKDPQGVLRLKEQAACPLLYRGKKRFCFVKLIDQEIPELPVAEILHRHVNSRLRIIEKSQPCRSCKISSHA
jgi:hypothetical protein